MVTLTISEDVKGFKISRDEDGEVDEKIVAELPPQVQALFDGKLEEDDSECEDCKAPSNPKQVDDSDIEAMFKK